MKFAEIKALAVDEISGSDLESGMATFGFRRSSRSLSYIRKFEDATQVLDIGLAANPSYKHKAIAHIYPRVHIRSEKLGALAAHLLGGDTRLLGDAPDFVVNRPFEHLVPLESRLQWYVFDVKDFSTAFHSVHEQFSHWGIEFFNEYQTVADIVRGYENEDDRPALQESWFIFVASAYLLQGSKDKAIELVAKQFSSAGAMRKYPTLAARVEGFKLADLQ